MAGNEVLAGFIKSLISRTPMILAQYSTQRDWIAASTSIRLCSWR